MEKQNVINQPQENQSKEIEVSLLEVVFGYLKHWKWFVLSVIVALAIAFVYLRYTLPVYNVKSTVILKHEKDQRGASGTLDGLEMMGGVSSIENEGYVMQSQSVVRLVVERLNLNTSYIAQGRIRSDDLYTSSPFIIVMDKEGLDKLSGNVEFVAQYNKDKSITVKGVIGDKEYDTKLTDLPGILTTSLGNISFNLREGVRAYYEPLHITISRPSSTVSQYRGSLNVKAVSSSSSVMNLSLNTSYPNKGLDFLNTLVEVYNYQTIEDKNMEATNTKVFINERLDIIDRELGDAEGAVEEYKLQQGMTQLEADLSQSMQQSSQYEQQLVQAETQLNIVNSLNDYVKNPANQGRPVPSNIGVQDPTLAATMNEYNKLLSERQRLSKSMEDGNPVMQKMDEQISSLRTGINQSIGSVKEGLSIERRNIANQARIYSGRVGQVPTRERQFTEIAREQQIKASLYLLLLEKREENALSLAATSNSAKTLDDPFTAEVVHPKKQLVFMAAFLLGLLLPLIVIYLTDLFQYKIRNQTDIDKISFLPKLGDIPHHDVEHDTNIAVSENATTEVNEAFRMIRTNLMLSLGKDEKVVVFTSTIPGEGKTFAALNTAVSLSLLDKKVLLLGADLRIPRISTYLNIDNDRGLTNYLSGDEEDVMKLVRPTPINKYFSVLPAGPIPPNPTELLSRDRLDAAFETLRAEFDYIIIDSSPAGLVTDSLIINRVSDASVYLCRANYSTKNNLKFANELMFEGKLKNMLLLVNDVKDFHGRYGYGYGYGYGEAKKGKKGKKK